MNRLDERMQLLASLDGNYRSAVEVAARSKAEYKLAEAREYGHAEGKTVKDRESEVLVKIANAYRNYVTAEAIEKALRVAIDINLASLHAEVSQFARESRIEKATEAQTP